MTTATQKVAIICNRGVVIDKKYGPLIKKYLPTLVLRYFPRVGVPKSCKLFQEMRQKNGIDVLILPRDAIAQLALATRGADAFTFENRFPPPILLTRKETHTDFLYEDQKIILRHLCEEMHTHGGTACLDLRAGYGKTFVAAGLISALKVRTLYIVPTRELAKQAAHDVSAALQDIDDLSIVFVSGAAQMDAIARSDKKSIICIAVINTALSWLESDAHRPFCEFFSLVIFDEVHMLCSERRLNIFWKAQTRFMFGMSATIGERRDGFDGAIPHHLHPLINAGEIPGFSYGENPFRVRVRAVKYYASDEYAKTLRHESTDQVFAHYMYEQYASDARRTELIVEETKALLALGHNIFIFSEERAHVEGIAEALQHAGVASANPDVDGSVTAATTTTTASASEIAPQPVRAVIFYGGVSDEERRVALCGEARIIIATYSYSGTGVSIVRMSAAILATPRYSGMRQIVGRILRRGSDSSLERVVVDIIDQKTCLSRQFYLRKNAYDFYGATYEKVIVRS